MGLEWENGFGMGKWVCEEMSPVFGMVWHCRDRWKMKMDWICQTSGASATFLIPVQMESKNCVLVLCKTTEGDPKSPVPIKIRILPLSKVSPHCPAPSQCDGGRQDVPPVQIPSFPSLRAICQPGAPCYQAELYPY